MAKKKSGKVETFEGRVLKLETDEENPGLVQGKVLLRRADGKSELYSAFLEGENFRTAWRAYEDCRPLRFKGVSMFETIERHIGFIESVETFDTLEVVNQPGEKEQ